MKTKWIAIIVFSILICRCSTPYQPKGALGGYSSYRLGDNTFRVMFKGNQHTKAETVYNYLERRCAEITISKGHEYFIIYEDSSYIDKTVFDNEPGLDDKLAASRKDSYLVDRKPEIDTNPRQTLSDQKSKIGRTYWNGTISTESTNVIGILKIQLFNEPRKGYEEQYLSANKILEKYKIE
jgi:hypothetical protein